MNSQDKPRRMTKLASLSTAAVLVAMPTLAACGEQTVHERAYCTDKSGQVVDERYCDDNGSNVNGALLYYIWITNSNQRYSPGQTIPAGTGHRFRYNSKTQRAKYGLPKTGKIGSGKGGFGTTTSRTTSKGGGFGSHGSSGSGSHGSSGGS